jgi:hypothetical protein
MEDDIYDLKSQKHFQLLESCLTCFFFDQDKKGLFDCNRHWARLIDSMADLFFSACEDWGDQ